MIQLIEVELAQLKVPELGLNVFGTNTVAIGLYRSLGFEVTSQQMAKRIRPGGLSVGSETQDGPPAGLFTCPAGNRARTAPGEERRMTPVPD